jgi:hypothetical protein
MDIKLNDVGDLELIEIESNSIENKSRKERYDLSLTRDNRDIRLKRALKTPLGYIGIYVLGLEGVEIVDELYGNDIYSELSEGLTLNLISRIRSKIIDAISRAKLDVNVREISVGVLDPHTVSVNIVYNGSSDSTSLLLNL